jgi:hypothetical protein
MWSLNTLQLIQRSKLWIQGFWGVKLISQHRTPEDLNPQEQWRGVLRSSITQCYYVYNFCYMICVGGSFLTAFVLNVSVLPHANSGPISDVQMQWQYHPFFNDLCLSTLISYSVSFGTDGSPHPTDELSKCSTDILRWFTGSYIFWDQLLNMCTELILILNPPLYQTRCFFPVSQCVHKLSVEFQIQNYIQTGQMLGKMKNACQMLLWSAV